LNSGVYQLLGFGIWTSLLGFCHLPVLWCPPKRGQFNRIVGPNELRDLRQFGDYGPAGPSLSGKYFAYTKQDAEFFNERLYGGQGAITSMRVPRWFIDEYGYPFKDFGAIPAVHFQEDTLGDLYYASLPPEILGEP